MSDGSWDPTNDGKTQAPPDNVADIEKARAKAAREAAKVKAKADMAAEDKPLVPVKMYEMLTLGMAGSGASLLSMPHERLASISDDNGRTRRPVLVGADDVCHDVDKDAVAGIFLRYAHDVKLDKNCWSFGSFEWRHAVDAGKFWLHKAPLTEVPKAFRFKSELGRCYHRASFDPAPGLMPLCDELFARMTNRVSVLAWIGSLFDPNADRQQYVYLYGQGGEGKGSLARLLATIFGAGAATLSAPPMRDKHWAWQYVNRRLIIFSDLVDQRALRGAELRSVVGGDAVTVDPKGGKPYTAELTCKLLVCSNEMPQLANNHADARRIIFAEMSRPKAVAAGYEAALAAEAPMLIAKAIDTYRSLCPEGGEIPVPDAERLKIGAWAAASDDAFEAFFDEHFKLAPEGGITARGLEDRLRPRWPRDLDRNAWRVWLRRTHGIAAQSARAWLKGTQVRVYYGFEPKVLMLDEDRVAGQRTAPDSAVDNRCPV